MNLFSCQNRLMNLLIVPFINKLPNWKILLILPNKTVTILQNPIIHKIFETNSSFHVK